VPSRVSVSAPSPNQTSPIRPPFRIDRLSAPEPSSTLAADQRLVGVVHPVAVRIGVGHVVVAVVAVVDPALDDGHAGGVLRHVDGRGHAHEGFVGGVGVGRRRCRSRRRWRTT
jgi:hypothetical protein